MDKLKMRTKSKVSSNIEIIGELFPNTITEVIKGYDKNHNPIIDKAIDFEILKQELSKDIVEGREERYQMNWPGKKEAILKTNTHINKTLRPCREESVDFDKTENLYIEGDNLDVLKLLQETYLNKVKVIYIDPPYNTGKDYFVYSDNFAMDDYEFSEASGQYDEGGDMKFDIRKNGENNGRFHSDWLNMMYPRLKLAKDLLRDDGAIFISIDDNESENLKKICNEIFGERNSISVFPWQSRQSVQNDTDISNNHEYVLAYAKIRRREDRRVKKANVKGWFNTDSFVCNPLPLEKDKFSNPDNDPRGIWRADPFDAPNIRPNLTYGITNPNTGEEFFPPRG